MIYLDTNILLYATLTKVDDQNQKDLSIKLIKELAIKDEFILSNLSLLEYSFVMKKANEDIEKIKMSINFFKDFVKSEKSNLNQLLINDLDKEFYYKNSFDFYHVIFAKSYSCEKLITFDKGFKKFANIKDINIKILNRE